MKIYHHKENNLLLSHISDNYREQEKNHCNNCKNQLEFRDAKLVLMLKADTSDLI